MADKQISQLVAATTLNNEDLLVIQQGQVAKKLSGEALALFVYSAAGSMIDEVNSAVEEAQAAVDELLEEKNTIAQTIADMAQLGTDTTLTTPAMAADAKAAGDRIADVEKDALAGLNQKTISDVAIASFDDGGDDAPVKELIVNINPVQDLHGQDSPYPAGGSAQILDVQDIAQVTRNGLTFKVSENVITLSGTAEAGDNFQIIPSSSRIALQAGTYTFSLTGTCNAAIQFRRITGSPAVIAWINTANSTATFTLENAENCYVNLNCGAAGTVYSANCKIQLESGSSATPWKPFANICPITGWTGCEVTRTGKNILPNNYSAYTIDNAYAFIPAIMPKNVEAVMSFKDKDTSVDVSNCSIGFVLEREPNESISDIRWCMQNGSVKNYTANNSSNHPNILCNGIIIFPRSEEAFNKIFARWDIQVEYGNTKTDYEAPNITALSVTFPDSAGTVYKGNTELISGSLEDDYLFWTDDGSQNWQHSEVSGKHYFYIGTTTAIKVVQTPICNMFKGVENRDYQYLENNEFALTTGVMNYINFRCDSITSVADFKALLAQISIQILFKRAAPVTYQLTPQQVRTLLKINNIWANTGNINTLIYRTIPITEEVIREIMGDYEEIIAGVESTGKATKNYYAGNLVIVDDILYKCLVNVASGETFTPGAGGNVSQTTIADELATLQALYDNLGNLALLSYTTA